MMREIHGTDTYYTNNLLSNFAHHPRPCYLRYQFMCIRASLPSFDTLTIIDDYYMIIREKYKQLQN
jgi:hypothetical protein